MPSAYLSKSDFKAAFDCATKLSYRKARYPTNHDDNEYIQFLADGGFMVELLAKAKYPGGTDLVSERDHRKAFTQTSELLAGGRAAVVYEAAALHDKFLARVDILQREGDNLHVIEVKSSSVGGEGEEDITGTEDFVYKKGPNKGEPKQAWMPYLLDVTFQRMVLQLAFPKYSRIKASLCLVNKGAVARSCETLGQFSLTPQESGEPQRPRARPLVRYLGKPADLFTSKMMVTIDVTELTDRLMRGVVDRAQYLASLLISDRLAKSVIPSIPDLYKVCKKCEYRLKGEAARKAEAAKSHGFQQCWGKYAATPFHILDLSRVTQIAPSSSRGPVEALLERGGSSYLDLKEDELGEAGKPRRERRFIQWLNSHPPRREHLPKALKNELKKHATNPGLPLHFLDFEACSVALPHHADMRPYERVAFQLSCHTLTGVEDERQPLPDSCHKSWLNTECEFPNFKFARALRECLGDKGTVYVWSHFEQTTLTMVLHQLRTWLQKDATEAARLANAASVQEVRDLAAWIEDLLGPEKVEGKTTKRHSPRIRDLHDLCTSHYFHPEMLGRTSIKVVLPAVWRHQPSIHNHPWFSEYHRRGDDGVLLDPYKVLPALPLGEDSEDEDVVNDGTGAIRIYQELIFRRDASPEFTANRRRLLEQYCKLDTAAMIMIWKHWRDTTPSRP